MHYHLMYYLHFIVFLSDSFTFLNSLSINLPVIYIFLPYTNGSFSNWHNVFI